MRHAKSFTYINSSNLLKNPSTHKANEAQRSLSLCPRLQSWQQLDGNLNPSSVFYACYSSNLIESTLNVIVNSQCTEKEGHK